MARSKGFSADTKGARHNLRLGDFDGDGDLDAMAKWWQGSSLFFYRNNLINDSTPPDPDNEAPVITAFNASSLGDPVMSLVLSVDASDPDDDSLTYTWNATRTPAGANPQFAAGENTTVTLDRAGNYTFEVVVSDGSLTDQESVKLSVEQVLSELVINP